MSVKTEWLWLFHKTGVFDSSYGSTCKMSTESYSKLNMQEAHLWSTNHLFVSNWQSSLDTSVPTKGKCQKIAEYKLTYLSKPNESVWVPRNARHSQSLYKNFHNACQTLSSTHQEGCQVWIHQRTSIGHGEAKVSCFELHGYLSNRLHIKEWGHLGSGIHSAAGRRWQQEIPFKVWVNNVEQKYSQAKLELYGLF